MTNLGIRRTARDDIGQFFVGKKYNKFRFMPVGRVENSWADESYPHFFEKTS